MNAAILLDGDFTRRLLGRRVHHSSKAKDIEEFCPGLVGADESITEAYYYDCPPFGEKRPMPISGDEKDFSKDVAYIMATKFQSNLDRSSFIKCKRGYLLFRGWMLKDYVLTNIIDKPCALTDSDFKPILIQKQVDMLIGVEITKFAFAKSVEKIYLVSADSDFLPAVQHAQSRGIKFVLVYDKHCNINKAYKNIFDEQRIL